MKINRIDEDNIRVLLVHKDLEERGVTILDLLGNQMQVEKFFYSILEEVDTDHSFSGTRAITFQVMPNSDGLELLISRSSQDSEQKADNRPIEQTGVFNFDNRKGRFEDRLGSDEEPISKTQQVHDMTKKTDRRYVDALQPDFSAYVAHFDSIEDLIDLGNFLTMKVKTSLYLYKDQYLGVFTLYKKDRSKKNYIKLVSNVNEYAKPTHIHLEVLVEHGKLLIKNNIFKTLNKYFK